MKNINNTPITRRNKASDPDTLAASLATMSTKQGDLTQLNTTDKSSVVNALKEIKTQVITNQTAINNNVAATQAAGSGSPNGTYATLTDLQTAYPTGDTRSKLVTADGNWYYWNGSAWTAGGIYQSTGFSAGSVTPSLLSKTGSVMQGYTLTAIPQASAFSGAFTMVLDKITSASGFVKLQVRSQTAQQNVPIYSLTKANGTFTVVGKTTVNLIVGLTEIKTDLQMNSGQYFGISFPASSAYTDTSAKLTQWYSPGTTTYNVGGSFIPNYQQYGTSTTFSFDYSLVSSYPAVTTDSIDTGAITNDKLAIKVVTSDKVNDGGITKVNLSKYGSVLQNYTLTNVPQTTAFGTAFTMVLDKATMGSGLVRVKIRSQSIQQNVTIYALTKSSGTFTVARETTINIAAGLNDEINTDLQINSGEYFGISVPASTAYYDTSSQLSQWYLPGTSTYTVGSSFVPNYQQYGATTTFALDFCVSSSNPSVSTDSVENKAITKNKLGDDVPIVNPIKKITTALVNSTSTTPIKIKLIGDSITQGVGGSGFAQNGAFIVTDGTTSWYRNPNGYCWANLLKTYFESKFNCTVTNNGCTGVSSGFVVQYLSTLIAPDDNIVICMIGTNNRNHAEWMGTAFYNDLQTIYNYCKNQGTDIIFMACIPASITDEQTRVGHMEEINHVISKFTSDNHVEYIDLFTAINEYTILSETPLTAILSSSDGLHPNDTGHKNMYRYVCKGLGIVAPIDGATW